MSRRFLLVLAALSGCVIRAGGVDCTYDVDADGVCDDLDPCPLDKPDDADGDGVCTAVDACEGEDDGVDADDDGKPDACDACPADADNDVDEDGLCADEDPCPDLAPEDCRIPIVVALQVDTFPDDTTWSLQDFRASTILRGAFEDRGEGAYHEVEVRADTQSCVSVEDAEGDGGTRGLVFVRDPGGGARRLTSWTFAESAQRSSFCFDPQGGERQFTPPKESAWLAEGACEVTIQFQPGASPGEVGWTLKTPSGRVLDSSGTYTTPNQSDTRRYTLTDGDYELWMTDTYGDGWDGAGTGVIVRIGTRSIVQEGFPTGTEKWFGFQIDCG